MALSKDINVDLLNASVEHISHPDNFGPGTWYVIHDEAYDCNNEEECIQCCKFIRRRVNGILCSTCHSHALDYISKNPPEKSIYIIVNGEKWKGVFNWTWRFHNYVNANNVKPPKPVLTYDTAYSIFDKRDEKCKTKGVCEGEEVVEQPRNVGFKVLKLGRSNSRVK